MSLPVKNYRHCAKSVASVIIHRSKGSFASIWWARSGCELLTLPGGPGGRVPLSLTGVPGQRAQLGLSIPVFHAPFHTATHRDTQGRSVPFKPSWSCLLSPCFCRGSCVRGFLCLFLPSASLSLFRPQRNESPRLRPPFSLRFYQFSVQYVPVYRSAFIQHAGSETEHYLSCQPPFCFDNHIIHMHTHLYTHLSIHLSI